MFDLIKGRGRSVFATRDSVIYLFNLFRVIGFHPPTKFRFLYYIYSSILTLFVIVFSPIVFNVGWIRDRHILSVSEILTCVQASLNVIGVPMKSISLVFALKRLRSIEPLLTKLDRRYTEMDEKAKIRHCAIKGNRIVFFYAISYMLYLIVAGISAIINSNAPLSLWIPNVNWRMSKWEYWFQFTFDLLILFIILLFQIVGDTYAAVYIYIIRTQVQLLANRVQRLGTLVYQNRDQIYDELHTCIIIHQDILRIVTIIEPIISVTMFVQFFIAAAIVSTTMINIFIFADFASRIAACIYLYCVLLQTWPSCFYATHLQSDCEQLSMSIFHSNWMPQEKRFNNLLIFFLHRTQKGIPLFAMKLMPVNLSTSLSIGKFSFSLYTFIQKMGLGKNLKN
ncbi:odorant receptor 7a-like [Eurosta solidaginis]|uniref:odorant receptor 7a-like n=1 Tax=Eurosta solidaginis TaxID=178769 RepID=UPI0035309523